MAYSLVMICLGDSDVSFHPSDTTDVVRPNEHFMLRHLNGLLPLPHIYGYYRTAPATFHAGVRTGCIEMRPLGSKPWKDEEG